MSNTTTPQIVVNGILFFVIEYDKFVLAGEEDLLPFMESKKWYDNTRIYRSLVFEGKFYAPRYQNGKLITVE